MEIRKYIKHLFLIFIFVIVFPVIVYCLTRLLEAKTDKAKIKTGETFIYSVSIKIDDKFTSPKIIFPDFSKFKIVEQTQRKNYSLKNGITHLEVDFSCKLLATQPGKFIIKEVIITDTNKQFKTNQVVIDVYGKSQESKQKTLPGPRESIEI